MRDLRKVIFINLTCTLEDGVSRPKKYGSITYFVK